jgi:hypothetical protein
MSRALVMQPVSHFIETRLMIESMYCMQVGVVINRHVTSRQRQLYDVTLIDVVDRLQAHVSKDRIHQSCEIMRRNRLNILHYMASVFYTFDFRSKHFSTVLRQLYRIDSQTEQRNVNI